MTSGMLPAYDSSTGTPTEPRGPRKSDAEAARLHGGRGGQMFRRLRYSVAASLDGCIAGPHGEFDWIPMDPEIDFKALYEEFDTIVMGRVSYEVARTTGGVRPVRHAGVRLLAHAARGADRRRHGRARRRRARTRAEGRRGQGHLALGRRRACSSRSPRPGSSTGCWSRSCPFVLGGGLSLAPAPSPRMGLRLRSHRVFETTGTVLLDYDVERR